MLENGMMEEEEFMDLCKTLVPPFAEEYHLQYIQHFSSVWLFGKGFCVDLGFGRWEYDICYYELGEEDRLMGHIITSFFNSRGVMLLDWDYEPKEGMWDYAARHLKRMLPAFRQYWGDLFRGEREWMDAFRSSTHYRPARPRIGSYADAIKEVLLEQRKAGV